MRVRRLSTLPVRRKAQQARARQTVEAVLQAVMKILERQGVSALTTNRIAEVAGVSVGSVYQYFADKQAIYVALHEQHVEQSSRLLERLLVDYADAPLEAFVGALVEGLIDAHAGTPELFELLRRDVPYNAGARHFENELRAALALALSNRGSARLGDGELERKLFTVVHVLDALVHGAALGRPPGLSLGAAKSETVRAILACLGGPEESYLYRRRA